AAPGGGQADTAGCRRPQLPRDEGFSASGSQPGKGRYPSMFPAARDRASPAPHFARLSAAEGVYVELLEAHKAACARGHPLLTEAGGSHLCDRILLPGIDRSLPANDALHQDAPAGNDLLPCWDTEARQLWLRGCLLKDFRQPARNQTALLDVFQEQG